MKKGTGGKSVFPKKEGTILPREKLLFRRVVWGERFFGGRGRAFSEEITAARFECNDIKVVRDSARLSPPSRWYAD